MKDIEIRISRETRQVDLSKYVIGNDAENLQGNLVFTFTDEFVIGQARLEYRISEMEAYFPLIQEEESYIMPIKNVITKQGQIFMQLVITEGIDEEDIPIFKSNVFYVVVNESINAELEDTNEYITLIDVINTKLNQIDNLDISAIKTDGVTTITITKKDGTQEVVEIFDGDAGTGAGTTNYQELENKPFINDVELNGNMSLEELGIPIKTSQLNNDSGFISEIPDEIDPTVPEHVKSIKQEDIDNWNKTLEEQGIYFLNLYEFNTALLSEPNAVSKNFVFSANGNAWETFQQIAFGNELESKIVVTNLYGDQMGLFYGYKISENQYKFDCEFIYKDDTLVGTHNFKFYFYITRGINMGGTSDRNIIMYRESMNLLTTDNVREYTPSGNYNPANKKYVDDSILSAIGDINSVLATLTTVEESE